MAAVTLGSKGLIEADLCLVENTSFAATFTHVDENGDAISHDGWSARARIQKGDQNYVLDDCVSFGEGGDIVLAIPATFELPTKGALDWDLMIEDPTGNVVRIAYGKARFNDSYAYDSEA